MRERGERLGVRWGWLVTAILAMSMSVGVILPVAAESVRRVEFDWERAVSLYKQGQYREAIAEFERVLAEYPEHADSWKFAGLSHYFLKENEQATVSLGKAIELKKKEGRRDPELYRALGQAFFALGRYEKALESFEALTAMQPVVAANFYLLGLTLTSLDRGEAASSAFEKAVALDPGDCDSIFYIASNRFRAGKVADAVEVLRRGLKISPRHPEMLGLLTESLLRQALTEVDEKTRQSITDEAARTATLLRNVRPDAASEEMLGRAWLAAKRYANAEQALTRAIELSRTPSAMICFNLGFALAQTKSWTRALERLTEANRLAPDDLNTLYYLGYVYENLRRYQQAFEAYSRAYELSGQTNDDIRASIERVSLKVRGRD